MDQEYFRKLLVQWASEDVYINQLTWEEGDALAEYLAKWYAAQQTLAPDECHEAVCEHKFTPVTNTLEVCVLCGIRR